VHIVKNLYAVPTPLGLGGAASKIEDFFDLAIKATLLGGKLFSETNDFNADTHYGKRVFAHKVIRPRAESIDFSGFRPLLSNIADVISQHSSTITGPSTPA
jgi:RNA-directed DNA polymerase